MDGDDKASMPASVAVVVAEVAGKLQAESDDEKKTPDPTRNPDQTDSTTTQSEKVTVGMVCEKKDLYQKIDQHNKATWTDEMPDDLVEAAENEETEKYALLVRNSKLGSLVLCRRYTMLMPRRKELRLAQEAGH
jgi:hypothetical protein